MSYTLRNSFNMGPANTGKALRGQIVDDAGANVGSAITTATELTGGKGVFEQIATIQDGQTGFLRIYFSDAPTVFLASIPLNPQEIENADAKTSTVVSAVAALPSASTIASAVWASGSRTLTSFGTLVADIWAYATRTLTSGAFSAASVWDYLTSSISTTGSIGKLLTDRIDASMSSRLASASYTAPDNTTIAATASSVAALPSAATIASAVWASGSRTLTSFGALVADIWANASRTLTSGAFSAASVWDYLTSSISTTGSIGKLLTDRIDASISSVAATVAARTPSGVDEDGSTIYMRRATTYDGLVTSLTIPAGWTKCIFTMKQLDWQPDDQSAIQIQVSNPASGSDGMIRVNGATAVATDALLIVNQSGGAVWVHVEDNAMAVVEPRSYVYDFKFYYGSSDSVTTPQATAIVNPVVTQTV